MALGGGIFTTQNKILPGSYINFVSTAHATAALADRGIAALALFMDWGEPEKMFSLEADTVSEVCRKVFGYRYQDDSMRGIRDVFKHARRLYGYRINGGEKAKCEMASARYPGVRGNDITLVVTKTDEEYEVKTLLAGEEMDSQVILQMGDLLDNEYLVFDRQAELTETAGLPLTGGTNKAATIDDYQKYLDQLESYSFHTLGCLSTDPEIKQLFVDFTKRMRDEAGVKFQTVLFQEAADFEGIISLENPEEGLSVTGTAQVGTAKVEPEVCNLIYWVTGASAGCAVNSSNTNRTYDGEFTPYVSYTQKQLEEAIQGGKWILHRVGDEIRVLEDVNTLVTYTEEKGEDFSSNQTIRVLDQIGNDVATLFNDKYLGKIPNDQAGRISFWNDLVSYYKELERIRAIENFSSEDVVVSKGEGKKSIVASCPVTPVNAMSQLYMTVIVE